MDVHSHDRLVHCLYEGVLAPAGWRTVLQELRGLTNSERTALQLLNCHSGRVTVDEAYLGNRGLADSYNGYSALADPCIPFIGKVAVGNWYFDMRELGQNVIRVHPFYQEFLIHQGLRSIMWTPLLNAGEAHAILSFGAGLRRTPFQPEDTRALSPLLPHLITAAKLRWRFQELSTLAVCGHQMLDRVSTPMLLIDEKARILFANAAGEKWLDTQNHPYSRQSTLKQATPWPQLSQLAHQICTAHSGAPVGVVRIDADGERPPIYLIGLPLSEEHPLAQGWSQQAGMLIVHDPAQKSMPWPELLRQLFHLTPAECRLVEQLAVHHCIAKVSEALGITRETVRSQLKAVFQKTGAANQSALMQLVTELTRMR